MKENMHPVYREVLFKDGSSGTTFLTRSTIQTKDTMKGEDGKEYPYVTVEISSASHPFYTGNNRILDAEGRIDKFMKRYGKTAKK